MAALSALQESLTQVFDQKIALVSLTTLIFIIFWLFKKNEKTPPHRSGLLPYIGCAIEFGKAPLWFIEESRKKLGPIFTLKVAGKRLTFLTLADDFHHFFTSPNVDFQKVVQDPVARAASVSKESFLKNHTKIHDTVKACLAPGQLQPLCHNLHNKFAELLPEWQEQEGELHQLVRRTMYIAVLDNLFGENTLPTKEDYNTLEKHFVLYDDQFEYGSQLPEFFIKDWSRSKWWLLGTFKSVADKLLNNKTKEQHGNTVLTSLFECVDRPHAGNYGLLLMWASLANAIPITFWSLAFILSHNEVSEKVRREISEVWSPDSDVNQEMVSKLVYTKSCILEAIRLRSPGVITRAVIKPMTIKGYTIPAGDHLMLSPYWAHRNPQYFPDPEKFKPERWDTVNIAKNQFLDGFVAFGGGRYQCPGRWFALLEIQLFIAMVMRKYDITLLESVPDLSPLHVVGTQQPVGSLRVKCMAL